MATSKAKTTMNKLNRERKIRERRLNKEARKAARVNSPVDQHADHREYWLESSEQPSVEDLRPSKETPR